MFFNTLFFLDIILTHKDEIKKEYYSYNTDFNFILTYSGKYYLEIYKSYNSFVNTKEGTFIAVLTERLIDIIDLSEKEYKNDKMIKLPREAGPNYYIITNLKKDKQFKFTCEGKSIVGERKNPFIICNNNTDECIKNVISYNFTKGINYTIYISYLLGINKDGSYYYYPSFRFYDNNRVDVDEGEDKKVGIDENKTEDNRLNTTTNKSTNKTTNTTTNTTTKTTTKTTTLAIINAASIGGSIILLILFLIINYFKNKKQNINFDNETNILYNENSLNEE